MQDPVANSRTEYYHVNHLSTRSSKRKHLACMRKTTKKMSEDHHSREDHTHEHGPGCSHTDAEHDDHKHGPGCGHKAVQHGDHIDYIVDGRLHHPHGDHCHDHGEAPEGE